MLTIYLNISQRMKDVIDSDCWRHIAKTMERMFQKQN